MFVYLFLEWIPLEFDSPILALCVVVECDDRCHTIVAECAIFSIVIVIVDNVIIVVVVDAGLAAALDSHNFLPQYFLHESPQHQKVCELFLRVVVAQEFVEHAHSHIPVLVVADSLQAIH